MRTQRGFTLIELLVVIAIIGILATLVITQLSGATIKARNSRAQSDVTEAGKGIQVYLNDDQAGGAVISSAGAAVTQISTTTTALQAYFAGVNNFTATGGVATYTPLINSTPSNQYTYKYIAGITTETARNTTSAATAVTGNLYCFSANVKSTTGGADTYFGTTDKGNNTTSC